MRVRAVVAVLSLVVLLACADAGSAGPAGTHEQGVDLPEDVQAACGGATLSALPPDTSAFREFAGWNEVDFAAIDGERQFFDGYEWFIADETSQSLVLFGRARSNNDVSPPYADASFEWTNGSWLPRGWGQCRIELSAPGWGNARFALDPVHKPDPESATLRVLATEVSCAGGRSPDGRDVRAVVLDETDEWVSIVILVEPASGGQTCPGNPSFPFEVQLPSPLGDRAVLDASVYPAIERPWPQKDAA
jgi:hypothetical protein